MCLGMAGLAAHTVALADDAACKRVLDAMMRSVNTPNHQYIAPSTTPGRDNLPKASETINTGAAMYVLINGKWRLSPISSGQIAAMVNANMKASPGTVCRAARDETLDGVGTAVYTVHNETDRGVTDSTVWISKASGLPVRQQLDLDLKGAAGKVHSDIRISYKNVKAPAV